MFYVVESLAEDVVDVYEFRVAHVCHTVVADKHDVEDISEVPGFDSIVQVLRKDIDLLQDFLLGSNTRV